MKRRPPNDPRRPAPAETPGLEAIFGLRAGLAAIERRRGDVTRVASSAEVRREVADALRHPALRGIPCSEVGAEELARLARSDHHEGLCVLTRPRRWTPPAELAASLVRSRGTAIALDRVRNPYTVGAILRSAAFFGVEAAILGAPAPHPALAPDAVRVAEGGAEHLLLARTTDLGDTLGRLRTAGVRVVGADGRAPRSALGFAFTRPTVLVLGHEREGMSERVRAQCDEIVSIPGSGAVESLNVAVAAGVLIAELTRRPAG